MMIDNYNHINSNLFYVSDNICGPTNDEESLKIFDDFSFQINLQCNCFGKCGDMYCPCLKTERYNDKNLLTTHKNVIKSVPMFECNDRCSCTDECSNRVIQKGPISGLIIKNCDKTEKGLCLFTNNFISKNTFICTYAGEIITRKEAERRHRNNTLNNKMNYIFCLKEHCNGNVTETIVDPSVFGNIGRYINHGCQPNSKIIPVRIDTPIPKLAIFSCVDIPAKTEITFDYGSNSLKLNSKDNLKKCFCLSSLCRQWMPYELY